MFVDTSVIVAILSKEHDARELSKRIRPNASTSALVILEAVMRLSSKLRIDPVIVEGRVQTFLDEAGIDVVPIDRSTATLAVDAFACYGKGRGRPAQLNLADCLSYACARQRDLGLLYKGRDFAQTDLA